MALMAWPVETPLAGDPAILAPRDPLNRVMTGADGTSLLVTRALSGTRAPVLLATYRLDRLFTSPLYLGSAWMTTFQVLPSRLKSLTSLPPRLACRAVNTLDTGTFRLSALARSTSNCRAGVWFVNVV